MIINSLSWRAVGSNLTDYSKSVDIACEVKDANAQAELF